VSSYLSANRGSSFMRYSYFHNNMDRLLMHWALIIRKEWPYSILASILRHQDWLYCWIAGQLDVDIL
jgi:hypothetical protein